MLCGTLVWISPSLQGRDDDLIELAKKFDAYGNRDEMFIGMAEQARQRGAFSFELIDQMIKAAPDKKTEEVMRLRFRLYYSKTPELALMWQQGARGKKGPYFLMLIRQTLREMQSGGTLRHASLPGMNMKGYEEVELKGLDEGGGDGYNDGSAGGANEKQDDYDFTDEGGFTDTEGGSLLSGLMGSVDEQN